MKSKTTTQKVTDVYTSKKVKNYALAFVYISIAISFISSINFYHTDWKEVSKEVSKAIENYGDIVDCKVTYQDFYYNGICTEDNLNIIFNFLNTTKRCQN